MDIFEPDTLEHYSSHQGNTSPLIVRHQFRLSFQLTTVLVRYQDRIPFHFASDPSQHLPLRSKMQRQRSVALTLSSRFLPRPKFFLLINPFLDCPELGLQLRSFLGPSRRFGGVCFMRQLRRHQLIMDVLPRSGIVSSCVSSVRTVRCAVTFRVLFLFWLGRPSVCRGA